MKYAATGVAIAATIASVAVYNGNQNSTLEVSEEVQSSYNNYLAQHGKSYETQGEYLYRLGLFARSVEIVNTHNSEYPEDHVVGLNYMADWSSEEY